MRAPVGRRLGLLLLLGAGACAEQGAEAAGEGAELGATQLLVPAPRACEPYCDAAHGRAARNPDGPAAARGAAGARDATALGDSRGEAAGEASHAGRERRRGSPEARKREAAQAAPPGRAQRSRRTGEPAESAASAGYAERTARRKERKLAKRAGAPGGRAAGKPQRQPPGLSGKWLRAQAARAVGALRRLGAALHPRRLRHAAAARGQQPAAGGRAGASAPPRGAGRAEARSGGAMLRAASLAAARGLATAGAFALAHPLDSLKVRAQLSSRPGWRSALLAPIPDGLDALGSGLSATVACRSATALLHAALLVAAHSALGAGLGGGADGRAADVLRAQLLAHGAAAAGAAALACPLEVALVRMQGDVTLPPAQRRGYRSVQDALWRIGSQEGLAALWSGLPATAMRAALQALARSASCVVCGGLCLPATQPRAVRLLLGWALPLGCRLLGLLLWLPADAVKSRQQHQLHTRGPRAPAGTGDSVGRALRDIVVSSKRGPAALFAGLAASAAYGEAVAAMQALVDRAIAGGAGGPPDPSACAAGRGGSGVRCGHLCVGAAASCPPAR